MKLIFKEMLLMPTCYVATWCKELGLEQDDEFKNLKEWQDIAIDMYENDFLDQIFDVQSKVTREEFMQSIESKYNWLFKAKEVRKKLRAKKNEK